MLKVGLIGNGAIAGAHKNGYRKLVEEGIATVVAICDIRPERLTGDAVLGFENARMYKDAEEMLKAEAGNLDFVDICVPTYLHSKMAIAAMEAGFDTLSEKPMARTVEQAQAMIETSKRTGKRLMIGYCNRFYEAAMRIKELIDTQKYGKVINAVFHRDGGNGIPGGWDRWYEDGARSGGAMLDLHIHDVDMVRWMFGMPKAITASAASYVTKDGYDIMATTYIYDNHLFVTASCDWMIDKNRFDFRVIRVNFERGYVYIDRTVGRQTFVEVPYEGEAIESEVPPFDTYYAEIKYFAGQILAGKPVEYNIPEESIDSIKMAFAEQASADNMGERVLL